MKMEMFILNKTHMYFFLLLKLCVIFRSAFDVDIKALMF